MIMDATGTPAANQSEACASPGLSLANLGRERRLRLKIDPTAIGQQGSQQGANPLEPASPIRGIE
jgi:hypothetical protein